MEHLWSSSGLDFYVVLSTACFGWLEERCCGSSTGGGDTLRGILVFRCQIVDCVRYRAILTHFTRPREID